MLLEPQSLLLPVAHQAEQAQQQLEQDKISPSIPLQKPLRKIFIWQWHTALQGSFYNAEILMDGSLALLVPL